MKTTGLLLGVMVLLIAGCGGGGGGGDHHEPPPPHVPPVLEEFHVIDSYGVDSQDYIDPLLALNPYIDGGQFEVYWYADNVDDYTLELRINDVPYLNGSRLISTDYCGPGLDCDLDGIQFCEYYADFSMSCDPPGVENPNQYVTDFHDLIYTVPQTMYLILDMCDTRSDVCEYQVREIELE
jgi:hypothetical protein